MENRTANKWAIFLLFLISSIVACNSDSGTVNVIQKAQKQNPNYVCDVLSNKIHSVGYKMRLGKKADHIVNQTLDIYGANAYNLIWQKASGSPMDMTSKFIKDIKQFNSNTAQLDTLYNQIYVQNKFKDEQLLLNKIDLDLQLTAAALSHFASNSNSAFNHKWDYQKKTVQNVGLSLSESIRTNKLDLNKDFSSPAPFLAYDKMKEKLSLCQQYEKEGGIANIGSVQAGKSNSSSTALAQKLSIFGDYNKSVKKGSQVAFDDELKSALKAFQERHEIGSSGTLNEKTLKKLNLPLSQLKEKIQLNMERMKWLPEEMGDKFIFVNVPEYTVRVIENNNEVMKMVAVVGDPATKTPMFSEDMTHLIFSPIWHVPTSIGRDEILKWMEYNPGLMYVGDIWIYFKGKRIEDPYTVDWEEAKKHWKDYSFKQKPTNQNSLGDVKFMFPNKYSVYLHDTPAKEYFGHKYRALSHGCVRVGEPAKLAQYLLDDKGWSISKVKSSMGRGSEQRVNLSSKVPVYTYYLTVRTDPDGKMYLYDDVYRYDDKQLKAMSL